MIDTDRGLRLWNRLRLRSIVVDNYLRKSVVLVRKKNVELRMFVDYRSLNRVTLKDNYLMPIIEDYLDCFGNKDYF